MYLNKLSENSMIYLTRARIPLGARTRKLKIHKAPLSLFRYIFARTSGSICSACSAGSDEEKVAYRRAY